MIINYIFLQDVIEEKEIHAPFKRYFTFSHHADLLINARIKTLKKSIGALIRSGTKIPLLKGMGKFIFTRLAGYLIIAKPQKIQP